MYLFRLNLQHALKINAAFKSGSEGGDGAAIIIFIRKIREERRRFSIYVRLKKVSKYEDRYPARS